MSTNDPPAQLDHAAVLVTDVPAALAFYGALGFRESSRLELASGTHAFLSLEGSVARLQVSGPVAAADPGAGHLALRVADVDGVFARLCAAGARSVDVPHDVPEAHARVAMVADPDGHRVELVADLGA